MASQKGEYFFSSIDVCLLTTHIVLDSHPPEPCLLHPCRPLERLRPLLVDLAAHVEEEGQQRHHPDVEESTAGGTGVHVFDQHARGAPLVALPDEINAVAGAQEGRRGRPHPELQGQSFLPKLAPLAVPVDGGETGQDGGGEDGDVADVEPAPAFGPPPAIHLQVVVLLGGLGKLLYGNLEVPLCPREGLLAGLMQQPGNYGNQHENCGKHKEEHYTIVSICAPLRILEATLSMS